MLESEAILNNTQNNSLILNNKPSNENTNEYSPIINESNSNKKDLTTIINYYRLVIELQEKDRLEFINLLESLKIPSKNIHDLTWEKYKRKNEKVEYEKALYESKIALNNERKKVLNYKKIYENCLKRIKEDKRRIAQLLFLIEPIEQTVKLEKDKKPFLLEKYSNFNLETEIDNENIFPHKNNNIRKKKFIQNILIKNNNKKPSEIKSKESKKKKNKCEGCIYKIRQNSALSFNKNYTLTDYDNKSNFLNNIIIKPSDEQQQIVRTIMYNENDINLNIINEENSKLREEISNLKENYENKLNIIEEKRKQKEIDFKEKINNYKNESENLMKICENLENINYRVFKDIMELKYDNGLSEKKNYELLDLLKDENINIKNELKHNVININKEKKFDLEEFKKKIKNIKTLKNQIYVHDEFTNIVIEQYNQVKILYKQKVKNFESKINDIEEQIDLIINRKNIQISALINEIESMENKIKKYQNIIKEYEKINGKDHIFPIKEEEKIAEED